MSGIPIVYALGDKKTGVIAYIGKTVDPVSRFYSYRNPKNCHNRGLGQWLKTADVFVEVLHIGAFGLDEAERNHIANFDGRLLNSKFEYENGAVRPYECWRAKGSIRCPSSVMARFATRNGRHPKLLKDNNRHTATLSTKDRLIYELQLAVDVMNMAGFSCMKKHIAHWLKSVDSQIVEYLQYSISEAK